AAIREPSGSLATAVTDGTISGLKIGVPYAAEAHLILVPARLARADSIIVNSLGQIATKTVHDHGGVFLLSPSGPGVVLIRTPSSTGEPEYALRMDDAPVEAMLGGADCARDLYQLAVAGACALADGAVAGALALTRDHVARRGELGRPPAAFPGGAQTARGPHVAAPP